MMPDGKVCVEMIDTFNVEQADLNSDDDGDIVNDHDEPTDK